MMQQTPNYKLNKPEMGDTFSPEPLNENADKLEAELARVDETAAVLDQRVVHLENCRIIVGVYKKYNGTQVIDLGGRPAAVLAVGHNIGSPHVGFVVGNEVAAHGGSSNKTNLRIVDNGFEVLEYMGDYESTFSFLAVMGDWVDIPPYVAP